MAGIAKNNMNRGKISKGIAMIVNLMSTTLIGDRSIGSEIKRTTSPLPKPSMKAIHLAAGRNAQAHPHCDPFRVLFEDKVPKVKRRVLPSQVQVWDTFNCGQVL